MRSPGREGGESRVFLAEEKEAERLFEMEMKSQEVERLITN